MEWSEGMSRLLWSPWSLWSNNCVFAPRVELESLAYEACILESLSVWTSKAPYYGPSFSVTSSVDGMRNRVICFVDKHSATLGGFKSFARVCVCVCVC